MVLIAIPEKESKIMEEVRTAIKSKLMDIAWKHGIDWRFHTDSLDIKEGINKIEYAMARICTKVKPDKQLIKDYKKMKEVNKKDVP
jgi:hypothetical protein